MQTRVYKQFYMIFVLIRACLWNASSSFASVGDGRLSVDGVGRGSYQNIDSIILSASASIYVADCGNGTEQYDFLRTQVSPDAVFLVFHGDKKYNKESLKGERARFLRLLLFPNHSFG